MQGCWKHLDSGNCQRSVVVQAWFVPVATYAPACVALLLLSFQPQPKTAAEDSEARRIATTRRRRAVTSTARKTEHDVRYWHLRSSEHDPVCMQGTVEHMTVDNTR